jgi:hypothetical protein
LSASEHGLSVNGHLIPAELQTNPHISKDLYKAWEKQDTFLKAFREGRMTVRQIRIPK